MSLVKDEHEVVAINASKNYLELSNGMKIHFTNPGDTLLTSPISGGVNPLYIVNDRLTVAKELNVIFGENYTHSLASIGYKFDAYIEIETVREYAKLTKGVSDDV